MDQNEELKKRLSQADSSINSQTGASEELKTALFRKISIPTSATQDSVVRILVNMFVWLKICVTDIRHLVKSCFLEPETSENLAYLWRWQQVMRNTKYCLSGEFSGSGENFPRDFKFKENIPWETVFYVVHYLMLP